MERGTPSSRDICTVVLLLMACTCTLSLVQAIPSPPAPCGTLDLTNMLTQHCFPEDGSHHFVCCVDISMPENPSSPHGNYNPLGQVIKAASNSSSYSWCTCSEEICEEQLGGRVAWNQHGVGWKGFAPAYDRPVLNSASGLPSSEL